MDEHVPRAITDALLKRGIDVLTVQEDGLTSESDLRVLNRAAELQRVVFTRDEDFLIEASRRQRAGEDFVGVVFAHQLRVSLSICIADLELLATATDPQEHKSHVQFLPLK